MTPQQLRKLERELNDYLESLTSGMGRPERREAMCLYMTGLLLEGERKSIEPMAARLVDAPGEVQGMRQRLQQCVTVSTWAERELFRRIAVKVDAEMPGIEALVIDDTGFAKKGEHSVGVARQYSGTLGRVDNCQVATSLHLAGEAGSACIGFRLYLPEEWAHDRQRRRKAGVPNEIEFTSKWQIALSLLDDALVAGVRSHVVLADSAYGDINEFRNAITERGLPYLVAVKGASVVYPPETKFAVPRQAGIGRPRSVARSDREPLPIADLAKALKFRRVAWREGSRGPQSSRFAAVRVRTAHRHATGRAPGPEQWLLCEWPADEAAPTKFYLSTLPAMTAVRDLVRLAKIRWRIERDYQEMKGELGLDHYEGRNWLGFHHHAALCAAAHAFLALRRALFPPEPSEVDAANGSAPPAARVASATARVPALPSSYRAHRHAARTVLDVIE